MNEDQVIVLAVGIALLIYLVPFVWVLASGRSSGGAKFGWFLVIAFFSWLGLAVFLIVTKAPIDAEDLDE